MKVFVVAVDGPAGAGKSTIAKVIADRMSIVYVDTGAMYRTVALFAIKNGIDFKENEDALVSRLDEINISIKYTEEGQRMLLDGEDVSGMIRTEQVSMGASAVAVIPAVRLKLVEIQRQLAKEQSVIMDGRDIGTYVFPDADIKIFLTASAEKRAERRCEQLKLSGIIAEYGDVLEDIKARDKNDSGRSFAPLAQAADAVLIDTTELTLEQSIDAVEKAIREVIK